MSLHFSLVLQISIFSLIFFTSSLSAQEDDSSLPDFSGLDINILKDIGREDAAAKPSERFHPPSANPSPGPGPTNPGPGPGPNPSPNTNWNFGGGGSGNGKSFYKTFSFGTPGYKFQPMPNFGTQQFPNFGPQPNFGPPPNFGTPFPPMPNFGPTPPFPNFGPPPNFGGPFPPMPNFGPTPPFPSFGGGGASGGSAGGGGGGRGQGFTLPDYTKLYGYGSNFKFNTGPPPAPFGG